MNDKLVDKQDGDSSTDRKSRREEEVLEKSNNCDCCKEVPVRAVFTCMFLIIKVFQYDDSQPTYDDWEDHCVDTS